LRDKLLSDLEKLDDPRRRFKCFQALLSSYFAFARSDEQMPKTAQIGWEALRNWLAIQRKQFERDGAHGQLRLPGWFSVLTRHANLLTETPCDRYGTELLRGDGTSVEEARQGLGIPSDSWVMEEAILSQMKAAVALDDSPFKTHLDALQKLVLGQTEVKLSDLIKRRATAMLISRYARCESKPEQPVLRDVAVSIFGNPWLRKSQWDAWVKKSNEQPDDEAREMINGWLTRQLITDFFALLSSDGQVDQRRLNYWLRFVPVIEGTPWLALGPDAMRNISQPYRDLRERAKGRLLRLENPGASSNNAFIMKMGDRLIVEFGMTGNACYVYPATPMPFSLGGVAISSHDLRDKIRGERLLHKDGLNSWESNFDQTICSMIGHWPAKETSAINHHSEKYGVRQTSSPTPSRLAAANKEFNEAGFWNLVKQYSLPTDDKRNKGGALWVNIEQSRYPSVDQWLEGLGFIYRPGRGWWKE